MGDHENEFTLTVDLDFWENFGSSSLRGLLLDTHPEITQGSTLDLRFVETTVEWRKAHGGPRTLLAPEYMPQCYAEDLLWLSKNFQLSIRCETA